MIKRNAFLATFAASCLSASLAFAECSAPSVPSKVPDGTTASEPEMVAAMQTLKKYNEDVTTYTKCLQFEEKQNRMTAGDAKRAHNAAVEKLESVAAKFNAQVQAFKSKKG